jgi:AraC family transcriptional regulator of adaptative response/methylated-DNA-[protein]-cysteine methyltransferase
MNLDRIARALLHAAAHYQDQPRLEGLAAQAGLSPAHFQREFQRLVGVSPKAFVQHLTARQAAASLRRGSSVLEASLDAGLSGPGRLHDLIVKVEGVSPGELALGGQGLSLAWARTPTPFGRLLVAVAPRGIAYAAFDSEDGEDGLALLKARWPKARLKRDPATVERALQPFWAGRGQAQCWVPGTAFQLQVWRALVTVPAGRRLSYSALAGRARLKGPRAVGSAVAANPVALLIPCHRVIQASGAVGDYHWGSDRKRALLAWEEAKAR